MNIELRHLRYFVRAVAEEASFSQVESEPRVSVLPAGHLLAGRDMLELAGVGQDGWSRDNGASRPSCATRVPLGQQLLGMGHRIVRPRLGHVGHRPRLPGRVCHEPGRAAAGRAAPITSAAFVTFSWWIGASWRIRCTPVPRINRRTRINRNNRGAPPPAVTAARSGDGCDIQGGSGRGAHTLTAAAMLNRRAGRIVAQLTRPLMGTVCHKPGRPGPSRGAGGPRPRTGGLPGSCAQSPR